MEKADEQTKSDAPWDFKAPRQYWSGQVQKWKDSGLTQKEYCLKEGISLERLAHLPQLEI